MTENIPNSFSFGYLRNHLFYRKGCTDNHKPAVALAHLQIAFPLGFQRRMADLLFPGQQDLGGRIQEKHKVGLRHEAHDQPRQGHRAAVAVAARIHQQVSMIAVEQHEPTGRLSP